MLNDDTTWSILWLPPAKSGGDCDFSAGPHDKMRWQHGEFSEDVIHLAIGGRSCGQSS